MIIRECKHFILLDLWRTAHEKQKIPAEEQYRLIMECRQSGLTDHQWCLGHDIKPVSFYNWVKQLYYIY